MTSLRQARRYWAAVALVSLLFLLTYLLVVALDVPVLNRPEGLLSRGGAVAALAGIGLLVADVLLPVPSSIVMVALGAMFGVAAGAAMALAGRAAAFAIGYLVGRRSEPLASRFIGAGQLAAGRAFLERHGLAGIALTRPVPILSETMSIMAGSARMPFLPSLGVAILGSAPEAVLFAIVGAYAASFNATAVVFVAVLLLAAMVWWRTQRRQTPRAPQGTGAAD